MVPRSSSVIGVTEQVKALIFSRSCGGIRAGQFSIRQLDTTKDGIITAKDWGIALSIVILR